MSACVYLWWCLASSVDEEAGEERRPRQQQVEHAWPSHIGAQIDQCFFSWKYRWTPQHAKANSPLDRPIYLPSILIYM
jgi:hypothetical protein